MQVSERAGVPFDEMFLNSFLILHHFSTCYHVQVSMRRQSSRVSGCGCHCGKTQPSLVSGGSTRRRYEEDSVGFQPSCPGVADSACVVCR